MRVRVIMVLGAAVVVLGQSAPGYAYDTLLREFGGEFGVGTSIEEMPLPGDGWPWFDEHVDHTIPFRGQFVTSPTFYGDSGERMLLTRSGGHGLCWRHTNAGFDDLARWCDTDGNTALVRVGVPLRTVRNRQVWADGTESGVFVGYGGSRVAVTYLNWQYLQGPDGQSAHSSLQVVLVDRSERAPGDFEIQWRAAYPAEALEWEGTEAFVNIVVDVNDDAFDLRFVQPFPLEEPYSRPGSFPTRLGPHPDLFFSESNENGEPGVWSLQIREGEVARCGNGIVESTEVCDDGNRLGGDACGETCDEVFDVPDEPAPDAGPVADAGAGEIDAGAGDTTQDVDDGGSGSDGGITDAGTQPEPDEQTRESAGSGCAAHGRSADGPSGPGAAWPWIGLAMLLGSRGRRARSGADAWRLGERA